MGLAIASPELVVSTVAAECQVTKILIGPGNKKALKKAAAVKIFLHRS
jgi:hypothetical protein